MTYHHLQHYIDETEEGVKSIICDEDAKLELASNIRKMCDKYGTVFKRRVQCQPANPYEQMRLEVDPMAWVSRKHSMSSHPRPQSAYDMQAIEEIIDKLQALGCIRQTQHTRCNQQHMVKKPDVRSVSP
jgi:hypothetical protein